MKTILVIIKKELKRFFTDRRMLIGLVLPGFLIFFIYSIMGEFVGDMATGGTDFNVVVINEQEQLSTIHDVDGWEINVLSSEKEEAIEKLKNSDVDLVIVYEEDFYNKMISYDYNSGLKAPNIEIYYNSTDTASTIIYQYYQSVYNGIESSLINKFDINGLNDKYDVASEEDFTMQMMTMIMPFLFVTLLFSGCMSVCSESIAGEKERGTIATLLVTPVKRSHLVIGKVISLGIVALFSAVVSFTGLMASIPKLLGGEVDLSFNMYGAGTFILIFVVILSTVLIFTVVLMGVSTFAKSVKYIVKNRVIKEIANKSNLINLNNELEALREYVEQPSTKYNNAYDNINGIATPSTSVFYSSIICDCIEGEELFVNLTTYTNPNVIYIHFINEDFRIISSELTGYSEQQNIFNYKVVVPLQATKIIVNTHVSSEAFVLKNTIKKQNLEILKNVKIKTKIKNKKG